MRLSEVRVERAVGLVGALWSFVLTGLEEFRFRGGRLGDWGLRFREFSFIFRKL